MDKIRLILLVFGTVYSLILPFLFLLTVGNMSAAKIKKLSSSRKDRVYLHIAIVSLLLNFAAFAFKEKIADYSKLLFLFVLFISAAIATHAILHIKFLLKYKY